MPLNPLHHYSLENPASVYDEEAMTALQLAARTAAKVNECVKQVNENTEKLPGMVTDEVQDQIENGTFDQQIDKFAGDVTQRVAECEEAVETQYRELEASLGTRVDNLLGSVPEGGTSMDAEVIDIRVGANNKTYPNAGEAVREQFTDHKETLDVLTGRIQYGCNAFIPDELIHGHYYYYNTGVKTASTDISTTPFIPCEENEDWSLYGYGHICVWDKNKTFLRGFASNASTNGWLAFNTGADGAYITIGAQHAYASGFSLGKGTTPVPIADDPFIIPGTALDEHQIDRSRYVDMLMDGLTPIPVNWEQGGFNTYNEDIESSKYYRTPPFSVPANIPDFVMECPEDGGDLFYIALNEDMTVMAVGGGWAKSHTVVNNAAYYRITYQATGYYQARPLANTRVYSTKKASGKAAYQAGFIPFTVNVNQTLESAAADAQSFASVSCSLKLPANYSPEGKPCPLVMICHGSGSTGLFDGGWTEKDGYKALCNLLNNAGYAVFDCNGYKDDEAGWNSYGAPRGLEGYRKAYGYVTQNYNVEKEFSIYGFSMGGVVAMNLAFSNFPGIKCVALGSPVLDIKEFCHDRNNSAAVNLAHGQTASADYDASIMRGFDPVKNIVTVDGTNVVYTHIPPVKIWFGANETGIEAASQTVNKATGSKLVEAIKNGNGVAYYREVANAAHEICWGANPTVNNEILYWINRFNG